MRVTPSELFYFKNLKAHKIYASILFKVNNNTNEE